MVSLRLNLVVWMSCLISCLSADDDHTCPPGWVSGEPVGLDCVYLHPCPLQKQAAEKLCLELQASFARDIILVPGFLPPEEMLDPFQAAAIKPLRNLKITPECEEEQRQRNSPMTSGS